MSIAIADVPVFDDTKVPQDETPPTSHELSCEECGKELTYAGRGRKPRFCDDHKKGGKKGGSTRQDIGAKNRQLAAQATEALVQVNSLGALGVMAFGMPYTGEAIKQAEDAFREQAYEALLTDPELCKTILRGGQASGRVALIIAYGMFGAAVGPVAVMEFKAKRAAALERKAEESEDRAAN